MSARLQVCIFLLITKLLISKRAQLCILFHDDIHFIQINCLTGVGLTVEKYTIIYVSNQRLKLARH